MKSGFYPELARTPAGMLGYYSHRFGIVEVDSTYYALPDPAVVFKWIAGTPKGFSFGVKSFSTFTFHRAKFSSLPRWLRMELGERSASSVVARGELTSRQRMRMFEDFIEPVRMLHKAGRLAYILYQFPPSWGFKAEGLSYIRRLREMNGPLPMAVEIRNKSWLAPENRERFLRALMVENIAYVAVDEPALGWTVGRDWPLTAEWGTLVRFHGRNLPGWRNSRASVHERFDYEYERSELEEWASEIARRLEMMGDLGQMFLMFNNCVSDKAVRGALLLRSMLGFPDPPEEEGRQTTFDFGGR
ncbi:MAG: DUF72 domain-containing protein [Synergistaceae bacterium]|nr:DUF72 domain-containing protein [Synergistaceae bacterium]